LYFGKVAPADLPPGRVTFERGLEFEIPPAVAEAGYLAWKAMVERGFKDQELVVSDFLSMSQEAQARGNPVMRTYVMAAQKHDLCPVDIWREMVREFEKDAAK
jgi:hypothetical protein